MRSIIIFLFIRIKGGWVYIMLLYEIKLILYYLTWTKMYLYREIIATSSTDAFIYIWDLRDPRRPKVALQVTRIS